MSASYPVRIPLTHPVRSWEAVGLDVYPNEPEVNPRLLEFDNVTLLPHMGTETRDSQKKMELRALGNLKDFLVQGSGKDLVLEMRPKL
jgi:glyoxylate reductase